MSLIFIFFLVAILLFLFRRSIQLWLLSRLSQYLFRDVMGQSQRQQARGDGRDEPQGDTQKTTHRHDKLDIDDIAKKKFEQVENSEYVEYEEIED